VHGVSASPDRDAARFGWTLAGLLVLGLGARVAYLAAQAATDPWFAYPMADAAANLEWARARVAAEPVPPDAFDLPPLYPFLLGLLFRAVGEKLGLVYFLQHVLMTGAAGLLALAARSLVGPRVGLATCALFLLYQPHQFFASRPLGEPLAIALLCAAVWVWSRVPRGAGALGAGALAGLAALGRPNLGLVAPLWAIGAWRGSRWRAALLLAAFAAALIPTTIRNYRVSGHAVPISSNSGLTLYHGNGPEPTGFIHIIPELAQSGKGDQRRIATRVASERLGRELDPVEADRYWGREALRERLARPGETVRLLLWRMALLGWSEELTLVMGPRQDPNPLRWLAPLPFAALVGLAVAGLVCVGWRGTGGSTIWGALVACASAPLLFYVCSRYRLPFAALLCLPAGAGLAALVRPPASLAASRRIGGWLALGLALAGSLTVPGDSLLAQGDAAGLVARARAWNRAGSTLRAEADLRSAIARNPGWAPAGHELAELLDQMGRTAEAEAAFRDVVATSPRYANAACGLGALLNRSGHHDEAVRALRQGLEAEPAHEGCWHNLLVALALLERFDEVDREVERARDGGVKIRAAVLKRIQALREQGPSETAGGGEADEE
jgi:Tfp pilus assembly protein PilF